MSASSSPDITNQPNQHRFKIHTYTSLTYCDCCSGLLWGIVRQGLKCEMCDMNSHEKCASVAATVPCGTRHHHKRQSTPSNADIPPPPVNDDIPPPPPPMSPLDDIPPPPPPSDTSSPSKASSIYTSPNRKCVPCNQNALSLINF